MQWKMARPGRLGLRFNLWAMKRGFPALAFIAPRWPRWLLLVGARAVITVVMAFNPRPKAAIRRNLARLLGEAPGSRRVRLALRQMLHHYAYSWMDLFRFAQLPSERARQLLDRARGQEHLERAGAQGRPVILLTAHLGAWELGGVFIEQLGLPLSVVYVPDQYQLAEAFRSRWRARSGVEEIAIRPGASLASLPVLRALKGGRVVALQGDRDFDGRGLDMEFFGAPAPFPSGPFVLARMTGAVLIPTFIAYTSGYRFEIGFGEPIAVDAGGTQRLTGVEEAMRRWVEVLEDAVRRWPTQWHTFYDFWEGGREGPAAGSGRRAAGHDA